MNREQIAILDHTANRAAGGLYCGSGPDMDALVAYGYMQFAGKKSFVPDPYYRITAAGRTALADAKAVAATGKAIKAATGINAVKAIK